MGILKSYSRSVDDAGRVDAVQAVTSTATILTNYGVSRVTQTGAASTFQLAAPNVVGLNKTIIIDTSTAATAIATAGSETFLGVSAGGTLTASSAVAGTARSVHLVAITTSLWGVASASTGISFA